MTCPFLKEAQVKYCQADSRRMLIPIAQAARADERCGSALHTTCPAYGTQPLPAEAVAGGACPYLRESLMQYCSAAGLTKFVPYSESMLSRCGTSAFRYCELYLDMAHPGEGGAGTDGLPLPARLRYSTNHMWLDVTDEGTCYAGIDAFLSRALGRVDRIGYAWLKGNHRPTVILGVNGSEVELVFPNHFLLTRCNLYLRADPARLTSQPYAGGWLFEGIPSAGTADGLIAGEEARGWMEQEQRRANEFLQQQHRRECRGACADGGEFATGILRTLEPERRLAFFHEFFPAFASEKRNL